MLSKSCIIIYSLLTGKRVRRKKTNLNIRKNIMAIIILEETNEKIEKTAFNFFEIEKKTKQNNKSVNASHLHLPANHLFFFSPSL